MNNLKKLYEAGQSPWYDNIERGLIKNGGLQEFFKQGIMGVTSNPAIFEKAINNSSDYDRNIEHFVTEGMTPLEIYDALTIQDVADAADMLLPVYKATNKRDGYVSIEVLPQYAHDAVKTIDNARVLFEKLNRPNIMIKIPGTKEGPEAIAVLIAEGININATLLFSKRHYQAIANAYIDGLKKRLKNGADIQIVSSVASVFVSRVDTTVDQMLDDLLNRETETPVKECIAMLKGKIAVANAKMIYQRYREIFFNDSFKEILARGGHVQRLLWGSTSTKNPAYSDVKYVEELIGKDTINTIPEATVLAFQYHGKIAQTVDKDVNEAEKELADLDSMGIDIDKICQIIQDEGVLAFQKAFDRLIGSIEEKTKTLKV
ncbi:MAG: transaldolase [Candidatus Omnitrophota bacterium]